MIVVLDSNIFLSALITPGGKPHLIYTAWLSGRFEIATCIEQIDEIRNASRHPKFAHILRPREVGIMLNILRRAKLIENLPRKHTANDPTDAFLLNLASKASAHFLISGNKRSGLIQRRRVDGIRILTPAQFCSSVLNTMG